MLEELLKGTLDDLDDDYICLDGQCSTNLMDNMESEMVLLLESQQNFDKSQLERLHFRLLRILTQNFSEQELEIILERIWGKVHYSINQHLARKNGGNFQFGRC